MNSQTHKLDLDLSTIGNRCDSCANGRRLLGQIIIVVSDRIAGLEPGVRKQPDLVYCQPLSFGGAAQADRGQGTVTGQMVTAEVDWQ